MPSKILSRPPLIPCSNLHLTSTTTGKEFGERAGEFRSALMAPSAQLVLKHGDLGSKTFYLCSELKDGAPYKAKKML